MTKAGSEIKNNNLFLKNDFLYLIIQNINKTKHPIEAPLLENTIKGIKTPEIAKVKK